jgi:putative PIN family toxin of toxin-antitoxin system
MKVVLDTNVLVSGLMSRGGTCAIILDLLVDGRITAALDGRIMDEYERVCMEPRLRLDPDAVRDFLHSVHDFSENVTATPLKAELADPGDLPFLEVAAEAAAVLVTGNTKHFPRRVVGAVQVVSPREFLDMLRLHPPDRVEDAGRTGGTS